MRPIYCLPLVAAVLLAACGGGADEAADEALTADEVAAEAEGIVTPLPGQYQTRQELLEIDVPGAPDGVVDMMRQAFADGARQAHSYCLTAEEIARGQQDMLAQMAESDCTVSRFEVTGGEIDAVMECEAQQGLSGEVTVTGTMGADRSDMVMSFRQEIPTFDAAEIRMRVVSERIGECPA